MGSFRNCTLWLRRRFHSAWGQLVWEVLLLGLGLYLLDIGTDAATAYRFHAHAGGHEGYSYATLAIMCVPGTLATARSLARREMGLGVGGALRVEGWTHLLVPPYCVLMCFWWLMLPVYWYLKLAGCLIKEASGQGSEEELKATRQRVIESRRLEGLGEAIVQFAFQIFVLMRSFDQQTGLEDFYPDLDSSRSNPGNALPYLQLVTSLVSFIKVMVESQALEVTKINGIRQGRAGYYLLYLLVCLSLVASKVYAVAYEAARFANDRLHGRDDNGVRMLTTDVVLMSLLLPLNVLIRRRTLEGEGPFEAVFNGFLSVVIPVNFVHGDKRRTKSFVVQYMATNYLVFLAVVAHRSSVLYGVKVFLYLFVPDWSATASIYLLLFMAYYVCGLEPLYAASDRRYPALADVFDRRATFPPDGDLLRRSRRTFDDLAIEGHFYSDNRMLVMRTTCHFCGWTADHGEEDGGGGLHEEGCGHVVTTSDCGPGRENANLEAAEEEEGAPRRAGRLWRRSRRWMSTRRGPEYVAPLVATVGTLAAGSALNTAEAGRHAFLGWLYLSFPLNTFLVFARTDDLGLPKLLLQGLLQTFTWTSSGVRGAPNGVRTFVNYAFNLFFLALYIATSAGVIAPESDPYEGQKVRTVFGFFRWVVP